MATSMKERQSLRRPGRNCSIKTSKARVRRYRERLRKRDFRRIELWLANGLIEDLCRLSSYQRRSLREVIVNALQGHVACYSGVLRMLSATQIVR